MPRGSRPGERRGGRKKGTRNKQTREVLQKAAALGEMPLDYMLGVMRDEEEPKARRDAMAVASAPYTHPRLSSVSGPNGGPIPHEHGLSPALQAVVDKLAGAVTR